MIKDFKTHKLALDFYKRCLKLRLPYHLRDQLLRATSSICLNLSEGQAKPTVKDQQKFYFIALGSLRESQSILELLETQDPELNDIGDHIGACLWKLTRTK